MNVKNVDILYTQPFIGGEYLTEAPAETLPVFCPINGRQIAGVFTCSEEHVDRAVLAAKASLPVWNSLNAENKGVIMRRIADGIRKRNDWIADLETLNTGIPIATTKGHFANRSAAFFDYFSAIPDKIHGRTIPIDPGNMMSMTIHQPLGVVAILLPWNAPFTEMSLAVAAAIGCGNAVVVKPASETPLTALILGEICKEAGLPAGVVNILPGSGSVVGEYMAKHPGIAKISFTGDVATGKSVLANTTVNLKGCTLELGGKAPVIICEDADLEYAIAQATFSSVRNSGQICTAAARLFIPESIAPKIKPIIVSKMESYKVGDPFDPNTTLGPMISKHHQQNVLSYIEKGKASAKLLTGGGPPDDPEFKDGYFIDPTLFDDVSHDSAIAQEEIFGPVLCLFTYKTLEEAVDMANSVRYGLAASIFTGSIKNAMYFLDNSEAGLNWVNCVNLSHPAITHGGFKESGLGVQNGMEAVLQSYTRIKTVWINKNI